MQTFKVGDVVRYSSVDKSYDGRYIMFVECDGVVRAMWLDTCHVTGSDNTNWDYKHTLLFNMTDLVK